MSGKDEPSTKEDEGAKPLGDEPSNMPVVASATAGDASIEPASGAKKSAKSKRSKKKEAKQASSASTESAAVNDGSQNVPQRSAHSDSAGWHPHYDHA